MKLRTLIADDESIARDHLRRCLALDANIEIVAECSTGAEVVQSIQSAAPDVAFLDIKMPGMDAFEALRELKGQRVPIVVFVTAHAAFASLAFDFNAVDYLLKPFDQERFQNTLKRVRNRMRADTRTVVNAEERLDELLACIRERETPAERFSIRTGGRIVLVNVEDIDWISTADNYAELHVGKATHMLRTTVLALAARLPKNRFYRISRSKLVNVQRIREIRSKSHGDGLVLLHDGTTLTITRNFRPQFENLLEQSG